MSLRGSLETFELNDVLVLVASTTKTGELEVATDRGVGHLHFSGGKVVAAELDELAKPVEVLACLLRAESGHFTFDAHEADELDDRPAVDVSGLLTQAEALVAEWEEIERVVPSPHVTVTLSEVPPAATFTVSAEEWALVSAIAGGCTVHELARYLSVDDLDASRGVKKLVEAGLVVVGDVEEPVRSDTSFVAELAPIVVPEPEATEEADEEEEDPTALVRQLASLTVEDEEAESDLAEVEEVAGNDVRAKEQAEEPLSRGTLLKFLSSVRT